MRAQLPEIELKTVEVSGVARESLGVGAAWMIGAQGVQVCVQAAYFILIARSLGANGYGSFVTVAAIVSILAPFGGWGSGNILVRAVSQDPSVFAQYWGRALYQTLRVGLVLGLICLLLVHLALPESSSGLAVLIAAADLIFLRLTQGCGQVFQAFSRLRGTAGLQLLPSVLRLLGIAFLATAVENPSATDWGLLYLGSAIVAAGVGIVVVWWQVGPPEWGHKGHAMEVRDGFHFSIGLAAQNVYNDLDKAMLARMASSSSAGVYAAGYRIIDVAFTPVRALLAAAYPEFFRRGGSGLEASLKVARGLMPLALCYSMLAGLVVFLSAPILPKLLGAEFHDSVEVVRWLSAIPVLRTAQYLAADTLTGAGFQGIRSGIQVTMASVNVLLNVWLIPRVGWQGAVYASLATDFGLAALMWGTMLMQLHTSRRSHS